MIAAMVAIMLSADSGPAARRPVVVELFTSEGCSSCPDADKTLAELDRTQPVAGAQVIALELHVDYWNRLGWADPFSSAAYSDRQLEYAQAFQRSSLYTPQAVVDGASEGVGTDGAALRSQIALASKRDAAQVLLNRKGAALSVAVLAPLGASAQVGVWLALVERGLSTEVPRGENAGRHLAHGPVVRQLKKIGELDGGKFAGEVALALPAGVKPENAQWVVFAQELGSRHIVGAAALR